MPVSSHAAPASACAVIGSSATSANTPGCSASTHCTAASNSGCGTGWRGASTGAASFVTTFATVRTFVLATDRDRARWCRTSRPDGDQARQR